MGLPMLVVDANVFVSALLRDSTTRDFLLWQGLPQLFAPEFIKVELFKYLPEFAKRLGVEVRELEGVLNELFDKSGVEIVSSAQYSKFVERAFSVCPDVKDVPYFALALKLDCPIWSNDKALKGQSVVKVFSTSKLFGKLKKR